MLSILKRFSASRYNSDEMRDEQICSSSLNFSDGFEGNKERDRFLRDLRAIKIVCPYFTDA
jgi:hypothetical protein